MGKKIGRLWQNVLYKGPYCRITFPLVFLSFCKNKMEKKELFHKNQEIYQWGKNQETLRPFLCGTLFFEAANRDFFFFFTFMLFFSQ